MNRTRKKWEDCKVFLMCTLLVLLLPFGFLFFFIPGKILDAVRMRQYRKRRETTRWQPPVSGEDFLRGCEISPDSPEAEVALRLRQKLAIAASSWCHKITAEEIAPDMTCGELVLGWSDFIYWHEGFESIGYEAVELLGKGKIPKKLFPRLILPEKKSRVTMRQLFRNYLDLLMPYLAIAGKTKENDDAFLAGCGINADTDDAKLALAIRATLAEQYHVPYENVVPELQWGKFKPRKKVWSIVDYWQYLESVMDKFRKFDLRHEDSLFFSMPYEGIDEKITVRDFVTSLVDIFNRYKRAANYLPNREVTKLSVDMETVLGQLKLRNVLLQGGTPDVRHEMVAEIVRRLDSEYTICRFPDGIKTKQDFWDAIYSFVPIDPRYELDGQSGLDMEPGDFERQCTIAQRPDKLLFVWEDVSPNTLSDTLAFIVEDYYEMAAWLQKPEKLRYLITLQQPIQEFPKLKLPHSDDPYCPYPVDSEDLTRSVIAICDFSGRTEAGK